jgi:serralysin
VLNFDQASNLGSLSIDFSGNSLSDFLVTTVGQAVATDIVV